MTAQVVVVPVYNKHNVPIWFKNRMRKKLLSSVLPYPQSVTFTFIIFFKNCHPEKSGKKLMLFIFETSGYNGQCDRLCLVWKIDFCFSSRNFAHFELKFGAQCYIIRDPEHTKLCLHELWREICISAMESFHPRCDKRKLHEEYHILN